VERLEANSMVDVAVVRRREWGRKGTKSKSTWEVLEIVTVGNMSSSEFLSTLAFVMGQ
jgi:hypothetical protein